MSTEPYTPVPNDLLTSPELTDGEKVLWSLLRMHCFRGDDTYCYPSRGRLANFMGKNSRSITRLIKGLRYKGYLNVELQSGRITRYWPTLPDPGHGCLDPGQKCLGSMDNNDQGVSTSVSRDPGQKCLPEEKEENKNKEKKNTRTKRPHSTDPEEITRKCNAIDLQPFRVKYGPSGVHVESILDGMLTEAVCDPDHINPRETVSWIQTLHSRCRKDIEWNNNPPRPNPYDSADGNEPAAYQPFPED